MLLLPINMNFDKFAEASLCVICHLRNVESHVKARYHPVGGGGLLVAAGGY